MKNKIQSMTIPKIKQMLRLRFASRVMAVVFTIMMVIFALGHQVMHWSWIGSLLIAAACAVLALASCVGYLILNKRLASGGL